MNVHQQAQARRGANMRALIEAFEPRTLLSGYTEESLVEHFHLPEVLYNLNTPAGNFAGFGAVAIGLGDINNDGKGDFAISATGTFGSDDGATAIPGAVFIYSGATGQVIRTLSDGFVEFGISLANPGDLNGDDIPDLLVGSPRLDISANAVIDPTGAAYIYSGADGSRLRLFYGNQPNSRFGHAVAAAGDVDGDGTPDALVGAPADGPDNQGRAYVLSGDEAFVGIPGAEIIYTFTGEARDDLFGFAVFAADMRNPSDQGTPASRDFLIGAPGNDADAVNTGRVYRYHGTVQTIISHPDPVGSELFGSSIVAMNTRLDNVQIVVGAPSWDNGPPFDSGAMYVFRADIGSYIGGTGTTVDQRYGSALALLGDLDFDGFEEFAGMSGSGARPRVVRTSSGDASVDDRIGPKLFGAGDVNGDGLIDVITLFPAEGRAAIMTSIVPIPPIYATGANDDRSFVFYSHPINGGGYAIVNGVLTPFADVPGLRATDTILGVNNSHVVAGIERVRNQGGTYTSGPLFIVSGGVRTLLADAVTQIVGGQTPDFTIFEVIKVANNGAILFVDSAAGASRSWLFQNGVLTYLFHGTGIDMNEAGQIIATRPNAVPVFRAVDGTITEMTGVDSVGALNKHGVASVVTPDGRLGTWANGVLTIIGFGEYPDLQPQDISDTGEILVSYQSGPGDEFHSPPRSQLLYSPHAAAVQQFPGISALRFFADGSILRRNAGFWVPETAWTIQPGSPLASIALGAGPVTLGVNSLNEVIVTTSANGNWSGTRWAIGDLGQSAYVTDLLAYADPHDGRLYAFVIASSNVYWGAVDGTAGGTLALFNAAFPAIVQATVFTTANGLVVLAGMSADNDLLIYYQTGQYDSQGRATWTFNNLTRDHIEARGQTFVPPVGRVAAFSTSWGSNHIFYAAQNGAVHTVWWAADDPLWRTDDLSAIAGAPAVALSTTPVHAFTTAWDALNIIVADTAGRPAAIWWVPGGRWRYDTLLDPNDTRLDMSTVTVFVTPWNVMSIIGHDEHSNNTVAIWWTPGDGALWRRNAIAGWQNPAVPLVGQGQHASAVTGNRQSIFVSDETAGLIEIFWMPGQTNWSFIDLTEQLA